MHAKDRTLLAGLGFADADKTNPLHDLACQYLASPERAMKILGLVTAGVRDRIAWMVDGASLEEHIVKGEGQYRSTIGFADLIVRGRCLTSSEVAPERLNQAKKDLEDEFYPVSYKIGNAYRKAREDLFRKEPVDGKELLELDDREKQEKEAARKPITAKHQQIFDGQFEVRWDQDHRGGEWQETTYGLWFGGRPCSILVEVKIFQVPTGDVLRQFALYDEYLQMQQKILVTAYDLGASDVEALKTKGIRHLRLGPDFDRYCASRNEEDAAPSLEI